MSSEEKRDKKIDRRSETARRLRENKGMLEFVHEEGRGF